LITSGLTYGMPNGSPVDKLYIANKIENLGDSLADMVGKLGKLPVQYQPGTRFHYSVSTDVFGRIIEVASGKSFDEFLRDRLFKPLDMSDTGFVVSGEKLDRFAATHRSGEKGSLKVSDAPATSRFRTQRKYLPGGWRPGVHGAGLLAILPDAAEWRGTTGNPAAAPGDGPGDDDQPVPAEALPMTLGAFRNRA
jgi:CubicO group peptidase (beta-lactamase class C family)